jgi:hypothetical protein
MDLQVTKNLLEQRLQAICEEEEKINLELQAHFTHLLGKASKDAPTKATPGFDNFNLLADLNKIKNFGPVYESVDQNTKKMQTQIEECNALSERLSQIVRKLDLRQMRAQKALSVTEDILNLKECKRKLLQAIEDKDLPAAVNCIKQVHEINEKAARTSEDYDVIVEKEKEVKELVRNEFQQAITESNTSGVMALCPLLQTLGLETEARDNFLTYMESKVFIAVSADAAAVEGATDPATAYAQALSSVFNSTCLIIQQYLPMVIQGLENSLGDVHFIRRLHKRCEQEAGLVIKRYMKYRGVKELVGNLRNSSALSPSAASSAGNSATASSQAASLAELHTIMNELALLIQYCCKYLKYLRGVCQGAENKVRANSSAAISSGTSTTNNTTASTTSSSIIVFSGPLEFDKMIDELINKFYMEGEQHLMRVGIVNVLPKAFENALDVAKNMKLDECFFILQKCGLRSIASHNIHAACACLTFISDLISNDLLNQGMELLMNSINKLAILIQDHLNRYRKRMSSDDSSSSSSNVNDQSSSNLSFGLSKLASTLSGGSGPDPSTSSTGAANVQEILFHEDGTFTLPLVHTNPEDPWGSASYLQAFNVIELIIRYTERLNKDLYQASQNVFMTDEDEVDHSSSASSAAASSSSLSHHKAAGGKYSKGTGTGKAGGAAGNKAILPATEFDKIKLCKENFDNIKSSYSNVSQSPFPCHSFIDSL